MDDQANSGLDAMDEASATLLAAFVAVYEPYVASRLAAIPGADSVVLTQAIEDGRAWLVEQLSALLSEPYQQQSRSPLEVFQEALRAPTEALRAAGVAPVRRDAVAVAAIPGDAFGLAPASSQELGDGVWQTHLAWGATKAAALKRGGSLQRPVVGLFSSDLMDRTKIEVAAAEKGYDLSVWRRLDDIGEAAIGLVDLTHRSADDAIRALVARGTDVVAFGPHVDDIAMARAGALGAAGVYPRSTFFRKLPELLGPIV